jgi:hypothetical protein
MTVMTGGVCVSVRERRGKGAGLVRGELGRLAPGCGPVGLLASLFYFFLLLPFSFISEFLFCVFERVLPFKNE